MFLTVDLELEVQHLREDIDARLDKQELTIKALVEQNKILVEKLKSIESFIKKSEEEKKKKYVSDRTKAEDAPVSYQQLINEWINGEEIKNE